MSDPKIVLQICDFDFDKHFTFALQHHLELLRQNFPGLGAGEYAVKLYEAHVKEIVKDPCCRLWVGEAGGRPVALLEASFRPNFTPAVGHISEIYVVPDLRRKGIATQMMRAAERWLKDRGAASIDLDVSSANEAAVAFYRKLGYATHRLNLKKPLDGGKRG